MNSRFIELILSVAWILLGLIIWLFPNIVISTNILMILPAINFQPSRKFLVISVLLSTMINTSLGKSIEIGVFSIPLATFLLILCGSLVVIKNIAIKVSISLRTEPEI